MNIYAFAPIAWALEIGYNFLHRLTALFTPLTATAAGGLSIIALTLVVRCVLTFVARSQIKSELGRRRIAPQLAELNKRFAKDPQKLSQKTLELHRAEGVPLLGGIGPALLQAPVLLVVYGLFVLSTIGGHSNTLLGLEFLGAPLGQSLAHLLSSGAILPGLWVYLGLLIIIVAVAEVNRRRSLSLSASPTQPPGASTATLMKIMPWLSYITAITAIFVPLAAALYLATTTVWTVLEREAWRKYLLSREAKVSLSARAASA